MNLIKKIISIVLVVCLVLSLSINSFALTNWVTFAGSRIAIDLDTDQTFYEAMTEDLITPSVVTTPSWMGLLSSFNAMARIGQGIQFVGSTILAIQQAYQESRSFTDVTSRFQNGDSFKISKSKLSIDVYDYNQGVVFHPGNFDKTLSSVLGASDISVSKVETSDISHLLTFSHPQNGYTGCFLSYDTISQVLTYTLLYEGLTSDYDTNILSCEPVQVPVGSVLSDCMITMLADETSKQNARLDLLEQQQATSSALIEALQDVKVSPAVDTSVPSLEGDWMTWDQGKTVITNLGSVISVLNSIEAKTIKEVEILNSAVSDLNKISYYIPQISNQLSLMATNQINFFQNTSLRLARIEEELTGLSLEPGKLFPLTLESVGFIKAFIVLIFGIFIAIFHFLGMFVAVAPDYLFFVPQGLMPFVMALPFLALFMVFLHWVRG